MEIEIVEKPSFAVIGKEGQGPSKAAMQWIAPLWEDATGNFELIRPLIKYGADGNIAGIWGAMSDIEGNFEPWHGQGKYLAGCEALPDAEPPFGWRKWNIPGFRYAVAECVPASYNDTYCAMLDDYFPKHGYRLVGAVQEFYRPTDINGEVYLYFPIERFPG